MTRRRIIILACALIFAAIAILLVTPFYRQRSLDKALARIERGTTEATVLELMGKPDRIETNVATAFWNDTTLSADVAKQVRKQYWYDMRWIPPVAVYWTEGFDADGRVISKHRWD